MKHPLATKLTLTAVLFVLCGFGSAFAQTIKGKVTDAQNQPLSGAAVFFKGTTTGVTTDADGNYSIAVRSGEKTLVFSFIGMKEQEVPINNRVFINVTLEEDSTFLDEAVAIGYSTVQRKDLLGSVASVSNKDVVETPVLNFSQALAGKLAGVDVRAAEGDPDTPVEIKVRGTGSITQDSSPLYIVDGFPVNSISDISPSDIKSVDVLKDAFSTAIYGSRGAYGVVLITTKDGARGKVTVSYDSYYGIKKMANMGAVEMMSPYEYALYSYESAVLEDSTRPTGKANSIYEPHFGSFQDIEQYQNVKGNDWKKLVFGQTGFTMNHNVNVSGNSDKTKWTASYANLKEDAIMMNSSYLRHNLALKVNTTPVKNLTFNFNTRWSSTLIQGAGANSINDKGATNSGRMVNALRYSPIPMDYTTDIENYDIYAEGFGTNPVRDVKDNDDRRTRQTWNLNGSVTWTIIPNLKLKVDGGMDFNTGTQDRFYGRSSYYTRSRTIVQGQPAMVSYSTTDRAYRASAVLSYNFNQVLPKKHKLDLLAGAEYLHRQSSRETTEAQGFPEEYTAEMARVYRGSAEVIVSSNNMFYEDDVILSFFGRGNYSFNNRYSVSGAIRVDGSSKFSRENRWGVFPSAAVSWNIANEPFMKPAKKVVNQLKLRYSIGAAGNNRIPAGNIRTQFGTVQEARMDGASFIITPNGGVMPNASLKWEKTISHNLGLDFALLKTRISGTFEAYHTTTKDLLVNFPTPGTGYNSQYRNLGSVLNQGVEATLRFVLVEKKNFGLTLSGNIALNQNRVLKLGVDEIQAESGWASGGVGTDFIVREGEPLGTVYGFLLDGYLGIDDFTSSLNSEGVLTWKIKEGVAPPPKANYREVRPGTPKFKDISGPEGVPDGIIDANDKVAIGNTLPLGTGGFALTMNAYGIDLNASFNFSFGNDVYNAQAAELSNKGVMTHKNLLRQFTPGNAFTCIDWNTGEQINDVDVLREVNANATLWSPATSQYFMCDYYIEDGSFLRISSVTLGYTIPQAITGRAHIKKLRIFCTGSNLFCFTKYSGFDPEVNCRRSTPLTPGVDYSAYPKSRGVIAGLNITF